MARSRTDKTTFGGFKNNTHPQWWKDPGLRVNFMHCVGLYFCVFYLGYDASLLNGLQAIPQWQEYFDHPKGNYLGLIAASLFLPAIVTPFMGSAINTIWGRKAALLTGSILLIPGAFINAFATSRGMFIAGRTLVGAAGPFGKTTAIALIQELAHPRMRPYLASCYYANYYVGGLSAAWFCYGSLSWGDTNWAWRAPCLFQIMAPCAILVLLFFLPESPRWLVHHDRAEEAMKILAKYHANGDTEDELVQHEYTQIRHALELEKENKRTTYMDFFRTPGNRRRLLVLVTMGTGTNWIGNGIIGYYLAPALKLVGITNPKQVTGINAGLALFNLFAAYAGALNAERAGRRVLWMTSTIGMLCAYIVMTGLSGSFAETGNRNVGIAVVPMMFIYYGFNDVGWTPLPFSYGAEILPYHMRLKGLSIMLGVQNVAQAFNQWVNPVALESIAWKYYIVYICLIAFYAVMAWFFFPETRRLTIEEVSVIFDSGRRGSIQAVTNQLNQVKLAEDLKSDKISSDRLVVDKEKAPSHIEHIDTKV